MLYHRKHIRGHGLSRICWMLRVRQADTVTERGSGGRCAPRRPVSITPGTISAKLCGSRKDLCVVQYHATQYGYPTYMSVLRMAFFAADLGPAQKTCLSS